MLQIDNLSDKDYLHMFCEWMKQYKTSHSYTVLNNDLEFVSASSNMAKTLGDENFLGKKIRDLKSPLAQYTEDYSKTMRVLDKITHTSPVSLEYLVIYNNNEYIVLWHHLTSKIINPTTGNAVGVYTNTNPVNPNKMLVKMLAGANKFALIITLHTKLALANGITEREHELLFLLSLGKTHKEIADILSYVHRNDISPYTVTTWINRYLYAKFDSSTISDVLEKAYNLDVLDALPLSFESLIDREIILY